MCCDRCNEQRETILGGSDVGRGKTEDAEAIGLSHPVVTTTALKIEINLGRFIRYYVVEEKVARYRDARVRHDQTCETDKKLDVVSPVQPKDQL